MPAPAFRRFYFIAVTFSGRVLKEGWASGLFKSDAHERFWDTLTPDQQDNTDSVEWTNTEPHPALLTMKVTYIIGPYAHTSLVAHALKESCRSVSHPTLVLLNPTLQKVSQGLAAFTPEETLPLHLIITLEAPFVPGDWPFEGRATVITVEPPVL